MKPRGMLVALVLLCAGSLLLGVAVSSWAQIPGEADVYVDQGILAYDAKLYGEALQAFQEALRIDPNNVNALYYLGLTRMASDQLPAAQEALERARALAPGDQDVLFQLAVSYFNAQQYEKAEPLFRQLYTQDPKRQNLGYYLGFMQYRKQDYREALRFFRANVASDESFAQLTRFYSSLALSALGLAGQARAEIEEAIRSQPVSPLVGPAERFRDLLGKAAKAERNWTLDAKLGVFYDDNMAVIPESGPDPAVVAARDAKHRSVGESAYLRFEYTPLKTPDWDGALGGAILGTVNNDVSHFNIVNPSLFGSLSYRTTMGDRPAVASLVANYDYMMLDDRNFSNRYTVAPALSVVWDQLNLSQVLTRLQVKDYMHSKTLATTSDSRDGINVMGGLVHYFRFAGDRHYLRLGYQLDADATEGSNWDYFGQRFIAGAQYTFPWYEIKARYDFDLHKRDYRHDHTFLPLTAPNTKARSDQEINSMVALFKEFPRNITLSVEWLWNRNDSNLEVFAYTRNVVTMAVSWHY